jgi:hypothetical protein
MAELAQKPVSVCTDGVSGVIGLGFVLFCFSMVLSFGENGKSYITTGFVLLSHQIKQMALSCLNKILSSVGL